MRKLISQLGLGREEGQVLPIFAAGALAMMLMTGVVVDGGNLFQNRQSLQNAADAAAIAAAEYLGDPTKGCGTGADPIGACTGEYAGFNGVKNQDGSVTTQLSPCPTDGTVTETKPPASLPGCYVYPYTPPGASTSGYVEVWLTQKTRNFFGGVLGLSSSTESARAVGTVGSGPPPPISFAALDSSCDNHTLLIKLGGHLQVNSGIYVNSCNQGDGFDVFGGGSISAPKIETNGGWETHDASNVCIPNGTCAQRSDPNLCSFPPNKAPNWHIVAGPPPTYNPTPAGCPDVGVPPIADPFQSFPPAPDLSGAGNVGAPVSITKISRALNGAGNNVAMATTAGPNGLQAGDSVTISGVGFGFDGTFTVAATPAPTATTFAYANTGPTLPVITNRQMDNGVVTLTTSAPTTLATSGPDTAVTVSGINNIFNIGPPNGAITGSASSIPPYTFSYSQTLANRTFTVTKKGLQQGTATLTLASTAGLTNGSTVNVSGADPLLDGSFSPITVAGGTITYPDGATTTLNVTNKAITTGTTVTLTTSTNHVFAGDQITVNLGDPRFDGNVTATTGGQGGGGTTLKYTIPAVTASLTNASVSSGTFTLTTASGPPIENGDTVAVSTGLLAYDNNAAVVSAVDTGGHTFVYAPGPFQNNHWSFSAGSPNTVTLTTASAHGLQTGNAITITGFTNAQACMNVTNKAVTVVNSTTFTFTVGSSCAPGAGGTQKGTIALVTVASHAISGTVSLTTASVPVSCNNCVTGPAYIAANTTVTPSGSAVLTDVPVIASGGTFTPAWMPTFGIFAENFPGSAAIPSPTNITTGNPTLLPGTYYGGICIGAPSGSNCVGANCKAAGGTTTLPVPYAPAVSVKVDQTGDDTDPNYTQLVVDNAGPISVGDLVALNDEEETVTAISGNVLTVVRADNGTEEADHPVGTAVLHVVTSPNGAPYTPAKKLAAAATATATTLTVNSTNPNPVGVGDIIQIDTEAMTVTAIPDGTHLTVTRGTYNTTKTTHANGAAILLVFDASAPPPPTVTLSKGVYIMAGGGFSVCGAASLNTPDGVMIYNTNDPQHTGGNGALGQVDINTAGTVHLHPMGDGIYKGMTIFQDRSLTLPAGTGVACNGKATNPALWDIALQSAAALPSSGELGSITGTIYSPHSKADVGDTMSGTSYLAVISSCIYINGATSTFLQVTDGGGGGGAGVAATLGG